VPQSAHRGLCRSLLYTRERALCFLRDISPEAARNSSPLLSYVIESSPDSHLALGATPARCSFLRLSAAPTRGPLILSDFAD